MPNRCELVQMNCTPLTPLLIRSSWRPLVEFGDNILEFQQAILHSDVTLSTTDGVSLSQRYTPLQRAGMCVPGGAAAYPSTVLMTAVPAQAAGVQQLAVVAPPTKFGSIIQTC